MRGREGGTLDEMRASMWLAEQYRRIGLTPMGEDGSWFQWIDMVRTRISTAASRASIGGQAMTLYSDLTPLDNPARIDYAKLTRMAQWMYLTGWFVATAPERPKLDPDFRLER